MKKIIIYSCFVEITYYQSKESNNYFLREDILKIYKQDFSEHFEVANYIIMIFTYLVKENDLFRFNFLNVYKDKYCEKYIYADLIDKIITFTRSVKIIIDQEKENEKNLYFIRTILEFFNSFFYLDNEAPLEIISDFLPVIYTSFEFLEYENIKEEILSSINNITYSLMRKERIYFLDNNYDLLINDEMDISHKINNSQENNLCSDLIENFLDVIINQKILNKIMEIEYVFICKTNENNIPQKPDMDYNTFINSLQNKNHSTSSLDNYHSTVYAEYLCSNSNFERDIENSELNYDIINTILNIFDNLYSLRDNRKLEDLSSYIFSYLYNLYIKSDILIKCSRLTTSIYFQILDKILNIIFKITSNPELSNYMFVNSKLCGELFDYEKFTNKSIRSIKLHIINNLFFKAKDVFFEIAELINKGAYKLIHYYLINYNDNEDINICLNCLYHCFEAGEISDENNFLLTFEIECGVEILEKLSYNKDPSIRNKIEIIFNKFIFNEKNQNYLLENNFYIRKNPHKNMTNDNLGNDISFRDIHTNCFDDFGIIKSKIFYDHN